MDFKNLAYGLHLYVELGSNFANGAIHDQINAFGILWAIETPTIRSSCFRCHMFLRRKTMYRDDQPLRLSDLPWFNLHEECSHLQYQSLRRTGLTTYYKRGHFQQLQLTHPDNQV